MSLPDPIGSVMFETFHNNCRGEISVRLIEAGINLGVFDYLLQPREPGEVAGGLKLDAGVTPIFLKALTLLGLVEEKGGRYQTSPVGAALFSSRESLNIIGGLRQMKSMVLDPLAGICGLIQNGPTASAAAVGGEETWAEAARAGAAWVFYGAGKKLADILESQDGFAGFTSMLDLGGGHGIFSVYVADRNPGLKIKVFDRPQVLKAADDFISEYGFEEQIQTLPGDYLTDDLGQGYDLILASGTLNFAYAAGALNQVIGKVLRALKPGGLFVSLHDACPRPGETMEKPGPILDHLAYSMLFGTDITLMRGSIAGLCLEQGFRQVRSMPFDSPAGELDLDIATK